MAEKRYLLTPGPTPVPPAVLAALAAPVVHHRGPEFREAFERLLEHLRKIFRTEGEVLVFTASGTAGMESAIVNVCSPGDRVLVASAGHFGERWAAIAKRYGLEVDHLRYAWGETPSGGEIRARLDEIGGARAVYFTHSETSTGVVADAREIAGRLEGAGALVVVDAISSLGAVPLEADAWGLDVVVSGSQKALMTPPGLALASASPAAREAARDSALPRYYLDWGRAGLRGSTPAASLALALEVACGILLEEGLEAAHERHVRLGRACRAGAKAMGLDLFSPDEDRSAVVTAVRTPPGIDAGEIASHLRERSGVTVASGQGELEGRILRIGHIGYIDVDDVATALAALELALVEAGADVARGVAAAAALDAYGEPARV